MRKILHYIHRNSESIFRTFASSEKKRKFINADPQSATTKPSRLCYFVVI